MQKKFSTIILFSVLLFSFALNGCQHNTETTSSTPAAITNEATTENTAEDTSASSDTSNTNDVTPSLPDADIDLLDEEKGLGITDKEQRKEMIAALGEETYWLGVFTAVQCINSQDCSMSPLTQTLEKAYGTDYVSEKVEITSTFDGHTIPADYILANGNQNNDTIIFIHGAQENRRAFPELIKIYLERGYNVLAYDQRSSGENLAPYCTFGFLEQYDLTQYVEYVNNIISDDKKLYVYARSQSGCTVGRVLATPFGNENIDGAILDCALSSMYNIISARAADYVEPENVEKYLGYGEKVLGYLFDGFTYDSCEMPQYYAKTTVPTLVLTCEEDTFVDKSMPISIYNAIPGKKYLYISEPSTHCRIHECDPEKYTSLIDDFFSGALFNES